MKATKRRVEAFSFFDHTHIERHLIRMAQHGWMLEKMGTCVWTYRRVEPQDLTFTVCYYPKASQFDPEMSEEQKEFVDFCERTGWKLAGANAQLQAFYNERENPTPIDTDPLLEVETIHKAAKRTYLPGYFVLLAIGLLIAGLQIRWLVDDLAYMLAQNSTLFALYDLAIVVLLCAAELIGYFLWRKRAKGAAERGEFLATPNFSGFQHVMLWLILLPFAFYLFSIFTSGDRLPGFATLLMLACVAVVGTAVRGTTALLKRRGAPRGTNRAVTIIVGVVLALGLTALVVNVSDAGWFQRGASAEAPLKLEDLIETDYAYTQDYEASGSLLLGRRTMCELFRLRGLAEGDPIPPTLYYTITDVKAPFLYDVCRSSLLRQFRTPSNDSLDFARDLKPVASAPWLADEAYQLYWRRDGAAQNCYLLRYGNRFVEIRFDWEPTVEQMSIVAKKPGNP